MEKSNVSVSRAVEALHLPDEDGYIGVCRNLGRSAEKIIYLTTDVIEQHHL